MSLTLESRAIAVSQFTPEEVRTLNEQFKGLPTEAILAWAWESFGSQAAIGTSFQGAGLVMLHLAQRAGLPFPVFTLDTGLLFPETLKLKRKVEEFFGIRVESLRPDLSVEAQAEFHGRELWKREPDLCCTIRKVLPLRDKLEDLDCWLTGLRREQSDVRAQMAIMELYELDVEPRRTLVKLNPMANWTSREIWDHIRQHRIPYNPLHDLGYRSIGCRPCTRKTCAGEGERAGRWTGFNKVECGIHTFLSRNHIPGALP